MNPYKVFTDPVSRVMITLVFIFIVGIWGYVVWLIFFYRPDYGAVGEPIYNLRAYEKHGNTRIWTYDYATESGRTVCVMMLKRGWGTSLLEIECPRGLSEPPP